MSRSGYIEGEIDSREAQLANNCWRGAVASAMRGKKGQAFLRELLAILDAMPEKRLIKDDLITPQGEVCAVGAYIKARGLACEGIDINDFDSISELIGVNAKVIQEIEYENDLASRYIRLPHVGLPHDAPWVLLETPEERWEIVRNWVAAIIREPGA